MIGRVSIILGLCLFTASVGVGLSMAHGQLQPVSFNDAELDQPEVANGVTAVLRTTVKAPARSTSDQPALKASFTPKLPTPAPASPARLASVPADDEISGEPRFQTAKIRVPRPLGRPADEQATETLNSDAPADATPALDTPEVAAAPQSTLPVDATPRKAIDTTEFGKEESIVTRGPAASDEQTFHTVGNSTTDRKFKRRNLIGVYR